MATFADLGPIHYFPVGGEALTAVGWLGSDAPFSTGTVSPEFFAKLKELCHNPWQPAISPGLDLCELCQFDAPGFSANLFVPYEGKIYVAPEGIVHYIAAHRYRPPDVFIQAVMACPAMNSMDYKKALLANGGRQLVNAGF